MTPLRSAYARQVTAAFLALSALSVVYTYTRSVSLHFLVEMAASKPSTAQLFYDLGQGFREEDSARVELKGLGLGAFQTLNFALPSKTIFKLRFDPLSSDGQVAIRKAAVMNRRAVLTEVPMTNFTNANQIASREFQNGELKIVTIEGANDPILNVDLQKPLHLRWVFAGQNVLRLTLINLGLLCLFLIMLVFRVHVLVGLEWSRRLNHVTDHHLARIASRLSGSRSFLVLDSFALRVYAGLLLWLVVAGALQLNGSSNAIYSRIYGNGPYVKPWIGKAREARSDEWDYVTPDILNQYYRAHRFDARESALGNHYVALGGNLPVKDITTLFRPQFWGFFVLPLEYAFAIYWQSKAVLLIGGVFTFLLWTCASSRWALFGALWYFFSPFTQWTYSWPSALPEMVGSICLAVVCFCYLTVGQSKIRLAVAAVGSAAFGINFIMCAYPPHLIPLAWIAAATVAAWCIAKRNRIVTGKGRSRRLAAMAVLVIITSVVGAIAFSELKQAISAVADTVYPGHRIIPGGTLQFWKLGSHFLQWNEAENKYLAALGNISEGSGFFWLAPVTFLVAGKLRISSFQRNILLALWFVTALLTYWCAYAASPLFGKLTGLDHSLGSRCLPALGLANIGIVTLSAARLAQERLSKPAMWLYLGLFTIVFWLIFQYTNSHLSYYFKPFEIVLATLYFVLSCCILLAGHKRLFVALLLSPLVLLYASVNPVERGLPTLTRSKLFSFVQSHRELLNGRWLVFAETPVRSGFLAASGLEVYTGLRQIPDVDAFPLLASKGLDLKAFNQLGFLNAHAILPSQPSRVAQINPGIVRLDIAPNDFLLRQLGIRFVAFDHQPAPELLTGLEPLSPTPIDNLWLYRITGS